MTHSVERSHVELTEPPATAVAQQTPTTAPDRPGSWWRQRYFWLVLLLGLVVFNLIYALPRYLSLDPSQSRSGLDPSVPAQFGLLVAHVVTGNVAMVTVLLQLWSWLRRKHPRVHRASGRVYILAGALPAAGLGLFALIPLRPNHAGSVGLGVMGVLWIVTTLVGWQMARRHRYAEHRRWMLYSFALALGTSWGRIIVVVLTVFPGLPVNFGVLVEVNNWLGWMVNLLIAHLWIESRASRSSKAGGEVVTYASPVR
ncbi:DUF2306 domain-containing protein [Micromonospora peucetia]|uniref:DUF2306 domain-containing protein n=1 Tax=Micromonospora peucetia TaxID=47871 RepID=A0ABZ1E8V0_9ACTN|nr:DUF2306 domain-containing protein [Micromonospora peucetia]MCX4388075.1 DUF2306 domain-containing protein [Micromonospora peucetia]WSA31237.1 DUF2306 domain-containing protein [Micromonospora peucetia]